jgi:hypothetical protein
MLSPIKRANLNHWTSLMLDLSKGSNRVGVSLPSPEDGNEPSFQNGVFLVIQMSGRRTTSINPVIL